MTSSPIAGEREAKEREAFEAWAGTMQSWVPNIKRFHPSGPYQSLVTASAWSAWQARAALLEPVGEGWVMVPKEPTKEMIDAWNSSDAGAQWAKTNATKDWQAMLAAALKGKQ